MKPPSSSRPAAPAHTDSPTTPAIEWATAHGAVDEVLGRVEFKLRRRRRRRAVVVGALGVLLIAGVIRWQAAPPAGERLRAAAPGFAASAPRQEVLDDGTIVELRSGAQLTVAFTDHMRRVKLVSGEAHFQVAKNPLRPFVVDAGGVDVRAVGTAFAVQLRAQAIEVIVTEGRVAVEKAHAAASGTFQEYASVAAGHRVVVDLAGVPVPLSVIAFSADELDRRLEWRVPRLELAATPLAAAIAFLNSRSEVRLVLEEPELGKLELSGAIRGDNPEPLLRLLHTGFGIEADRRPGEIILRRRR